MSLLVACGGEDGGTVADTVAPDTVAPDTGGTEDVIVYDTVNPGDTGAPADTWIDPDAAEAGGFLAPCQGNLDCIDGYCVEGVDGFFCTRTCSEECPNDMDCKSVLTGSADPVFLCLPRLKKLCLPCKTDFQCTGGACLTFDDGGWCGYGCDGDLDCPEGYECLADPSGAREGSFCQPRSGSCTCTDDLDGAIRTCLDENAIGTCYGVETCDPETGWVDCTALEPTVDTCDGLDNDCNGLVDDGVEDGGACENTVAGVGSCAGTEVCLGPQGLVCNAATPSAEVCDFKDNDCDGEADEDFKDGSGEWTTDANCGTCGNDCATKIAHGVGRCDATGSGSPVCVVDECDDDYIAINQFQCALPPDVSCQPCLGDDDCFGGSCVTLDNQEVCVSPCGGAAGSCADGYSCEDVDGAQRCVPVTGSCVCNELTDGKTRSCSNANAWGTCFGQETCDAETGWSDCSATVPAAETCDGEDNNCNGVIDDGVTPPDEPCEETVEGVGQCTGTWYCNAPDGGEVTWTCSAPVPAAETCNFRDDDCDGLVDEGYKDAGSGLYLADDACGACGVSCDGAIPNASAGCVERNGVARCEVVECAEGYYPAGPLTCLAVTEDLCTPCQTDANCPTPGDTCLDLDGGRFCGRDCSDGNLHGEVAGVCPDGFSCEDVGGAMQCQPTSGSCGCLPEDDGQTRTCLRTNGLGTCYGQETCDPDNGWVGCTVSAPEAEVCDGVDNDCNGAVDDVPGRGAVCQRENVHGSCDGVMDCAAGSAELTCVGREPAAETCNYVDDDCDGHTDDTWEADLFQSCSDGLGACQRFGYTQCKADGSGTQCSATEGAESAEICDNIDNDCDGFTDEEAAFAGKGEPCTAGLGVCQVTGVRVCKADGTGLTCSVTPPAPGGSDPCDGLDNDCNGVIDDAWADELGDLCSAGVGACKAFGNYVCNAGGTDVTCNAVVGQIAPEVCDLVDNNCNGVVDDGFLVDGRYVADDACGNCFTDCEAIFDGAGGGYGTCNSAPATPRCKLTCCRANDPDPACDGGDYFDLNGIPDDGCEFELDDDAIYVSESEAGAVDNGSCGLSPAAAGLGGHACEHIQYAIGRAQATGRSRVLVAGGAYVETVTVKDGVSLYGGYSPLTWQRDTAVNRTSIFGSTASGHKKTLVAVDITANTTVVDGFTIYGQVAGGTAQNSYAVYIRRANAKLQLTNNVIWGGTGGPGTSGSRGGDGTNGGNGFSGAAAREPSGAYQCYETCSAAGASSAGGSGGSNSSCSNANGGKGGGADCPDYHELVNLCLSTDTGSFQSLTTSGVGGQGSGAGTGGKGGCDSRIDPYSDAECSCLLPEPDAINCPLGGHSAAGGNGAAGEPGSRGGKCSQAAGRVVSGEWQGYGGGNGGGGSAGAGGGGGGAGGGVEQYWDATLDCGSGGSDFGGSGGGGGAGGCGSGGGTGGGPGGGAFGIFVVFDSAPGANIPTLTGNTVHTGTGGVGGRGGDGGTPGNGGNGGAGGAGGVNGTDYWCANPGSKGGEGGKGGAGGGGGGACGGASYGLFVSGQGGANLSAWTANPVVLDGAGGAGGVGGQTAPGGTIGQNGDNGSHTARNF